MIDSPAPTSSPFPLPVALPGSFADARGCYLTGDDHLRITTFNSAAGVELAIEGRYRSLDGKIVSSADRHVPNTNRTAASTVIRLGEGWLVDVLVRATAAAPRVGQCFALLELVRGFTGFVTPVGLLAQGYVTATARFGWPGSGVRSSTDGAGVLRSILGTDPAAGLEVSETVPTNARWRPISMRLLLTTDATVANRVVRITLDDGANEFFRVQSAALQTASLGVNYGVSAISINDAAVSGCTLIPWPGNVLLPGGSRIRTITSALQAGDNYGPPQLLVEEWIEV